MKPSTASNQNKNYHVIAKTNQYVKAMSQRLATNLGYELSEIYRITEIEGKGLISASDKAVIPLIQSAISALRNSRTVYVEYEYPDDISDAARMEYREQQDVLQSMWQSANHRLKRIVDKYLDMLVRASDMIMAGQEPDRYLSIIDSGVSGSGLRLALKRLIEAGVRPDDIDVDDLYDRLAPAADDEIEAEYAADLAVATAKLKRQGYTTERAEKEARTQVRRPMHKLPRNAVYQIRVPYEAKKSDSSRIRLAVEMLKSIPSVAPTSYYAHIADIAAIAGDLRRLIAAIEKQPRDITTATQQQTQAEIAEVLLQAEQLDQIALEDIAPADDDVDEDDA